MKRDLEEKKEHGTAGFPLQCYNEDASGSHSIFVSAHWHENLEIIRVTGGTLQVLAEGKHFEGEEGDLFFISPGKIHQLAGKDTAGYLSFVFSLSMLRFRDRDDTEEKYLGPVEDNLDFPLVVRKDDPLTPEICRSLNQIDELYRTTPFAWELMIKAELLRILSILLREHRFLEKNSLTQRGHTETGLRTRELLNYIEKHYAEKISLDQAASIMHMSPRYFCSFFRKNFYMSFVTYLNRYRIERSLILLQTTDRSVSEIAELTGFDNFSYFIRKFKEFHGMTPTAYRKEIDPDIF